MVLRIFRAYVEGLSVIRIVRLLNEEGVPGRLRSRKGWSPATVSRMLDNEKYIGRWVWNKTEQRRGSAGGSTEMLSCACIRVGYSGGRVVAYRATAVVGTSPLPPQGSPPELAWRNRTAWILRSAGESGEMLPHALALGSDGLRQVRRDDSAGKR